jgi:WhiB family redox-sensing transcriptional regulator
MTADTDLLVMGLCTQVGGDVFFPDVGQWTKVRAAKAICARCDIAATCRQDALDDPSLEGIWGGTTAREREQLRRDGAA